jgi:uncharacterized protein
MLGVTSTTPGFAAEMPNTIRVVADALYIYPVKSCGAVCADSLTFDEVGALVGDREWAIVDESASVVWQGSHPRLALIHPEIQTDHVVLRAADGKCTKLGLDAMRTLRGVQIWNEAKKQNDVFAAIDAGDEAAAFLETVTGAKLRLVRLGREAQRRQGVNRVHIASCTSFNELAVDLPQTTQLPENLARFRPNVVVTGLGDALMPFMEEQFTRLQWATGSTTAALEVDGLCVRCVVPNVDQATAAVDPIVLEVVSRHSAARYPGGPIYFGIYARPMAPCILKRGTALEVNLAI